MERFICAASVLSKHKVLAAVMKARVWGLDVNPAADCRGRKPKDGGERILTVVRSLTKENAMMQLESKQSPPSGNGLNPQS